jgi:hypothetical protein
MTMKEKLERSRGNADRLNEALLAAVKKEVGWLEPEFPLSTIGGMPPKMLRIGLVENTEMRSPLVILHRIRQVLQTGRVEEHGISVFTPQEASMWDYVMIDQLPSLDLFLRKYALGWPAYVHTPRFAWIRREQARATA